MDSSKSRIALAHDPPFNGDPSWRVTRELADGTRVTIRPIAPEDREALRIAFYASSPRTRYMRFLGVIGELSESTLTYLTCVDQRDHVALVATITSPDLKTEHGLGIARFIRLDNEHDTAEAAITVADEAQRKGLGTLLAIELARAARELGVRRIRAEVLADNQMMRAILESTGAKPNGTDAGAGLVSYDIELEPHPLTERLMAVLRVAAQTMALSIRRLVPPTHEA